MVVVPLNDISVDERGIAYITATRMKVRQIAIDKAVWNQTPEEIQDSYPHLSLAQIHAALSYYYSHKAEIDAEIENADQEVEAILAEVGHPINKEKLEARLLQKQAEEGVS